MNYTPDEEQVREQYTQEQPPPIGYAEFDRFLAKIRADAWDECARSAGDMASPLMDQNPYRRDGAMSDRTEQARAEGVLF